jgi:hypothetical protein
MEERYEDKKMQREKKIQVSPLCRKVSLNEHRLIPNEQNLKGTQGYADRLGTHHETRERVEQHLN